MASKDKGKATGKKTPMKTASNVVKRVLWDQSLPERDISIGYIDRFIGILEKPFGAFSWEPLASMDYFTFGVPEHRIQYFKYKDVIIWDKRTRLDYIFGSTGSGVNIQTVMEHYDDFLNVTTPVAVEEPVNSEHDDSDDDNVAIAFDDKAATKEQETEYRSDEEEVLNKRKYWQDKLRPNFFICQRIENSEIRDVAREVQKHVVNQQPLYDQCCHSPDMLHMTLCTLRIETAFEAAEVMMTLKDAKEEMASLLPKKPLNVRGVDRFFGRVLYAAVEYTPELEKFVDHVRLVINSRGFRIADNFDFVPHITLIKVDRPTSRALGTKTINPALFSDFEGVTFGTQIINNLYLCSMEKTRDSDGFYISPGNITFMRSVLRTDPEEEL